jgi:hypothetical protein
MSGVPRVRLFRLLVVAGFAVRLLLIATSIGTTDVVLELAWVDLIKRFGIAGAYAVSPLLNHPPLSLALMRAEDALAQLLGMNFTDILRLVQVGADALTVFALYRIGRLRSEADARWVALFIAISPASAFISGFHSNTDAMMVALTVTAAWLVVRPDRRAALAGIALALAAGIKIVPLLLVPFFLLVLARKEIAPFLGAFAAVCFAIFVPAAVIGGPAVVHNIFGYSGMVYDWGFPRAALLLGKPHAAALFIGYGKFLVIAAVALTAAIAVRARRRDAASLLAMCGAALLSILFVAPGFGVQYLDWPLPFLPFALSRRAAVALNAAFSLFLFLTYTIWNGGWPWWYADISEPRRLAWLVSICGLIVWIGVGAAALSAIRRLRRSQTEFRTPTAAPPPSPGIG